MIAQVRIEFRYNNYYITKMVTFESMRDVYFDSQTSEGNT